MSAISGTGGINTTNVQSMDLETAMMMVQSQRANLLDGQLKTQMESVQNRNAQIGKLNEALATLNVAAATYGDAKADTKLGNSAAAFTAEKNVNDALAAAGVTTAFTTASPGGMLNNGTRAGGGSLDSTVTKSQIDAAVSNVKGMIDAQSNSQQMDMLRLQSLSNKRNEAFDLMTNFVKKMADSRSSIVGNMR